MTDTDSSDSPTPSTSSTVARWEFARRIKVRRTELGLSIDDVAKHLGFTRNFFSAVENERSMLAADKLDPLFELLQLGEPDRGELTALLAAARNRSWWEKEAEFLDEAGARYIGLEQGASSIRTFESLVWPGLLQLPEYAAAVFATDPRRSRVSIDDHIAFRGRRQQAILDRAVPVVALISEAVVLQHWGTERMHQDQLRHALELTDKHDVEIRILPLGSAPGLLAGCSTLVRLSFDSPHLPDLMYEEAIRAFGILEEGDPRFDPFRLVWEDGMSRTLTAEQSVRYVQTRVDMGTSA